jgi:uncharacterized protein Usg|tara:strand:- start:191 stop:331 length:141 start_codon:yes stop_codon:yes gene_type:complete
LVQQFSTLQEFLCFWQCEFDGPQHSVHLGGAQQTGLRRADWQVALH